MNTHASRSAQKSFGELWDRAHDQALVEFPKPTENGFYNVDRLESRRTARRWQLIIEADELTKDHEEQFFRNLNAETYSNRDGVTAIAALVGFKTSRVSTLKLKRQLFTHASRSAQKLF